MQPSFIVGARNPSDAEQHVTPRIWAGCLAAYNSGHLHGHWIEAAQEPEEIQAEINDMLAHSPVPDAEEWAIFDQEGWSGIEISEHETPETLSQLAALIEEHGPLFGKVVEYFGGTRHLDEAVETMTDRYQGTYSSLADWAETYADDTGIDCSAPWKNYIDFERWANDAEMGGDIFTIDLPGGHVAIFSQ